MVPQTKIRKMVQDSKKKLPREERGYDRRFLIPKPSHKKPPRVVAMPKRELLDLSKKSIKKTPKSSRS